MTENQQRDVLDRFRKGEINLLIATDIAQEGLGNNFVRTIRKSL
jgi:ERCC4-related helicase